jgi:hypothetical protein
MITQRDSTAISNFRAALAAQTPHYAREYIPNELEAAKMLRLEGYPVVCFLIFKSISNREPFPIRIAQTSGARGAVSGSRRAAGAPRSKSEFAHRFIKAVRNYLSTATGNFQRGACTRTWKLRK